MKPVFFSRGVSEGGVAILALFFADLIVRTSYQIGKAPVLTLLALNFNAAPLLLGTIASISTTTGFVLKPFFGILSDRHGRWLWLVFGTALFAGVPLLYGLAGSPGDLVALRLFHGLATAIYGPITLAYVAAASSGGTAEAFGWFGLARTAASVAGPLIGGAALTVAEPEVIYAATGLFASLAFLFVLRIGNVSPTGAAPNTSPSPAWWKVLSTNRPLMLIGTVEATVHVAIYAVKGFAPFLLLMAGSDPITVGTFLATQEAVAAVSRPVMGHIADRVNPTMPMVVGMILISCGLVSIASIGQGVPTLVAALLIGAGQGAFGPAALSLVSKTVPQSHLGFAYGAVGALRNGGKIFGPVLAGALTVTTTATTAFLALATIPLLSIALIVYRPAVRSGTTNFRRRKVRDG